MLTDKKCTITDIEVSVIMKLSFEHNPSSEVTSLVRKYYINTEGAEWTLKFQFPVKCD
jgi:hypothetical protein